MAESQKAPAPGSAEVAAGPTGTEESRQSAAAEVEDVPDPDEDDLDDLDGRYLRGRSRTFVSLTKGCQKCLMSFPL
jgi:hypothetical protein